MTQIVTKSRADKRLMMIHMGQLILASFPHDFHSTLYPFTSDNDYRRKIAWAERESGQRPGKDPAKRQ